MESVARMRKVFLFVYDGIMVDKAEFVKLGLLAP
jgi:hypothetical protein